MKFYLDTAHPVAVDSPDHIEPRATMLDNTVNLAFNKRLGWLFSPGWKIMLLDLGCAGGGMVKTFLDQGHIAVGLEGSDYNLLHQRAEWATIPDYLFTCDASKPFTLHVGTGKPSLFDVVTMWEFIEHVKEEDLPGVFDNIHRHLRPGGYVIGSTCQAKSIWKVIDHHQTRQPWEWWAKTFTDHGFTLRLDMNQHFTGAWVRAVQWNFVLQG